MALYGFRIDVNKANQVRGECVTVQFMIREPDQRYPLNPKYEGETAFWGAGPKQEGLLLDDLVIYTYVNRVIPGKESVLGPVIEYQGVSYLGLEKAEKAVYTLKRIKKAVAKAQATEFGDVIMAVCKDFGLSFYAKCVGNISSSYAQNDWSFGSIQNGRDDARHLHQRMVEGLVTEKRILA